MEGEFDYLLWCENMAATNQRVVELGGEVLRLFPGLERISVVRFPRSDEVKKLTGVNVVAAISPAAKAAEEKLNSSAFLEK